MDKEQADKEREEYEAGLKEGIKMWRVWPATCGFPDNLKEDQKIIRAHERREAVAKFSEHAKNKERIVGEPVRTSYKRCSCPSHRYIVWTLRDVRGLIVADCHVAECVPRWSLHDCGSSGCSRNGKITIECTKLTRAEGE